MEVVIRITALFKNLPNVRMKGHAQIFVKVVHVHAAKTCGE
jgi:hypothetical protein